MEETSAVAGDTAGQGEDLGEDAPGEVQALLCTSVEAAARAAHFEELGRVKATKEGSAQDSFSPSVGEAVLRMQDIAAPAGACPGQSTAGAAGHADGISIAAEQTKRESAGTPAGSGSGGACSDVRAVLAEAVDAACQCMDNTRAGSLAEQPQQPEKDGTTGHAMQTEADAAALHSPPLPDQEQLDSPERSHPQGGSAGGTAQGGANMGARDSQRVPDSPVAPSAAPKIISDAPAQEPAAEAAPAADVLPCGTAG